MKDYHSMSADQMSAELREMAELAPTPDLQECYQRAAALLTVAQGAMQDDDPTANEQWNAGCDFALAHLCKFLGVDFKAVSWDAATETVDGDVLAVIGNILRVKFGEDWGPNDAPALTEGSR
jgi:hypothetical protein